MSVFISWAGTESFSHRFAICLKDWIAGLFTERLKCFVSTNDITAGTTWLDRLFRAIDQSEAGIIVVTKESIKSEWLLFEAGALARKVGWNNQRLCPLLLDLHPSSLNDPLGRFQYKTMPVEDEAAAMEGMRAVVSMLHQIIAPDAGFPESILTRQFEVWWPKLWKDYLDISRNSSAAPAVAPAISSSELYLEVRNAMRQITESLAELQVSRFPQPAPCPYCGRPVFLEQPMKPGETRLQVCGACGRGFNVHANQSRGVFTRPAPLFNMPHGTQAPVSLVNVTALCCHCRGTFSVQLPDRPGSTVMARCVNCGTMLNVHTDGHNCVFTRPGTPGSFVNPADRPDITHEEFLRETNCWIDTGDRRLLVECAAAVLTSAAEAGGGLTPASLAAAMAERCNGQPGIAVSRTTINRFVKMLLHGGAFRFDGNPATGVYRSRFVNFLTWQDVISALCRSYVRRLRMKFAITPSDLETIAREIDAGELPGGREALAQALQEPEASNIGDKEAREARPPGESPVDTPDQ